MTDPAKVPFTYGAVATVVVTKKQQPDRCKVRVGGWVWESGTGYGPRSTYTHARARTHAHAHSHTRTHTRARTHACTSTARRTKGACMDASEALDKDIQELKRLVQLVGAVG